MSHDNTHINDINANRQPIVSIKDGEAFADSRDVAAYFDKKHQHVLEAYRNAHCSDHFRRSNFRPFKIKDLTGESISHVEMTKNGFSFLVMGFTGAEAGKFKEAYILQFDAMEAELRRRPALDLSDPASLRSALLTYSEKVIALEATNATLAPKATVYDMVISTDGLFTLTTTAKLLKQKLHSFMRYLEANKWIYRLKSSGRPQAYQPRIDAGYVAQKVYAFEKDGEDKASFQVLFTVKGVIAIAKKLGVQVPDKATLEAYAAAPVTTTPPYLAGLNDALRGRLQ